MVLIHEIYTNMPRKRKGHSTAMPSLLPQRTWRCHAPRACQTLVWLETTHQTTHDTAIGKSIVHHSAHIAVIPTIWLGVTMVAAVSHGIHAHAIHAVSHAIHTHAIHTHAV